MLADAAALADRKRVTVTGSVNFSQIGQKLGLKLADEPEPVAHENAADQHKVHEDDEVLKSDEKFCVLVLTPAGNVTN